MPNAMLMFGDSITFGHGVAASEKYATLLAAAIPALPVTNLAVSGHQAADQAWQVYGVTPDAGTLYTALIGTNDAYYYGASATKLEAYRRFLRTILVWPLTPTKVKARSGMSFSGVWSDTPVNLIGRMTTQLNATATASVSGSTIYIGYIIQNHAPSEGTFDVEVDGVVVTTVTANGTAIGNTATGRAYSLATVRIAGLTAGAHTVRLISKASGLTVFIDYAAGNQQAARPKMFVGTIPYRGDTAYDAVIDDYNAALTQVVSELVADGFEIKVAPVGAAIVRSDDLLPDGIHPNPAGHVKIANTFADEILGGMITTDVLPYVRGGNVVIEKRGGVVQRVMIE